MNSQLKKKTMNKKRKKTLTIIFIILAIEIVIGFFIKPSLEKIGSPPAAIKSFFGITLPGGLNYMTVIITWVVMAVIIFFSWLMGRNLKDVPGKMQAAGEVIVSSFLDLCEGSLKGRSKARKYLPLIGTLFIFVLISNWLPILPIPGLEAPTQDLNTSLALALLVFFVSHHAGIKYKGFKNYIWEYFEPAITVGKVRIPNLFMGALNIVGEFGKVISHSFRLFGNILGGTIIILIISNLIHYIALPVILHGFFDFFIGGLQAFIFGMLALTYISLWAVD